MVDDPALNELRKISKILVLAHGATLEKELSKIMSTDERKMIWVAIDGQADPKLIADRTKVPLKTVSNFLSMLRRAELVGGERGAAPQKRIEYVPPDWLDLNRAANETKGGEQAEPDQGELGAGRGDPPSEGDSALGQDRSNPPS
jgi:hypothetical protein